MDAWGHTEDAFVLSTMLLWLLEVDWFHCIPTDLSEQGKIEFASFLPLN